MSFFKKMYHKRGDSHHSVLNAVQGSLDNFLEEGVFRWSSDNHLIFANGAFIRMFGFSFMDELHGSSFDRLFADDESLVYLKDRFKSDGIVIKHRILCQRKDGDNFWGSVSGRKVWRNKEIVFDGVINNINEQIEAEEKLKQKQSQLEKLTMEMDRFIYSASHEIRSPVSTLLGIINLMKHELKDDDTQQYVNMLGAGIDRLDQIVYQLTGHVKNFKNRVDDKAIGFDLMILDILNEFNHSHPAYSMVTTSYDIKNTGVFYSDPGRLRLILYNVLKNSFDYADSRKSVRVLSITIRTKSEKAIIEIFDNGIGISSNHVDRVFDMFYRATNLAKGSGIGLYTVREMVTKLGGVITLSSEYGIGTSVRIELPNSRTGKLINKKALLRSIR